MSRELLSFWSLMDTVSRPARRAWHVQMTQQVDMSAVVRLRNASLERITYTAVVLKAIAMAFREISADRRYVGFNSYIARWPWKRVIRHKSIVAGLAVERDLDGADVALHVTLRDVDRLSLVEISRRMRYFHEVDLDKEEQFRGARLAMRLPGILRRLVFAFVRNVPRLRHQFYGTFCLSTVGKYGPDLQFTAPECIRPTFGFGMVKDCVVAVSGRPVVRPMANISMTFDRLCTNGAPAARLMARVKETLEYPDCLSLGEERLLN